MIRQYKKIKALEKVIDEQQDMIESLTSSCEHWRRCCMLHDDETEALRSEICRLKQDMAAYKDLQGIFDLVRRLIADKK